MVAGRLGSPTNSCGNSLGQSVFDYVDKLAARSPVFSNFLYSPAKLPDSQVRLHHLPFVLFRFIVQIPKRKASHLYQTSSFDYILFYL